MSERQSAKEVSDRVTDNIFRAGETHSGSRVKVHSGILSAGSLRKSKFRSPSAVTDWRLEYATELRAHFDI
jgi:hypothetical protein